jgi:hypothetical protein
VLGPVRRIAAAALAGAGAIGLCAVTIAPGDGRAHTAASVVLQVAPRGLGSVTADPPGRRSDDQLASTCSNNIAQQDCPWSYERGTRVTLTAKPDSATGRTFAGWSTPDCPGTGTCTVLLDDDTTSIVARFTPLRLAVRLSTPGAGTINTDPAGSECKQAIHDATYHLCREFPPGTRVTVNVTPGSSHTVTGWNPGCEQVGPTSCAIIVLDEATWVGALLDNDPRLNLPTTITVQFKLRKNGSGSGRVTASKLDCGSDCADEYGYATSLTLTAAPDEGSTFDGWGGVCAATQTRCTVPIGPITAIDARFTHVPAAPSAPRSVTVTKKTRSSLTVAWPAAAGEAGIARYGVYIDGARKAEPTATTYSFTGLACGRAYTIAVDAVDDRGQRSSKATATGRTAACAVAVKLTDIRVKHTKRARTIVVTLRVDQAATVRVRLVAHGHVAAGHRYHVQRGKSVLRFGIPRKVASGRYTLRVKVAARGATTVRSRVVVVPARR